MQPVSPFARRFVIVSAASVLRVARRWLASPTAIVVDGNGTIDLADVERAAVAVIDVDNGWF